MPLKRLCKKYNIFAPGPYLLVLIAIGLAVLLASCTSFDHLTTVTEESFPQAAQCGKCHVEIYNEWANSDHAKAFTNPHFRRSTNNYTFEKCLSCHAPEPFVTDRPAITRTINRDEGVTCVSCHLKEGKLSGPIEPTGKITPHPIGVNPDFYNDSGLCGKCHQREYSEWGNVEAANKQSCQHCHMPQITRKVTQATGGISNLIVAMEHEVPQKKHDFSIVSSETKIDIISSEAKKTDSTVAVTIKNNLPHSLPTGDFGFRILKLKISALNTHGNLTVIDQRELTKELDTAIPALSTLALQLQVPVDTASIRVQLTRHSYEKEKVINLTDVEMPLK
jgi:hypothetical protein